MKDDVGESNGKPSLLTSSSGNGPGSDAARGRLVARMYARSNAVGGAMRIGSKEEASGLKMAILQAARVGTICGGGMSVVVCSCLEPV